MRFMVLVKADASSEMGAMPSTEIIAEMTRFNEELVRSGVLLAAEGLLPSSRGSRVRFAQGSKTVTDGPFAETKELIAGFWILQCKSKDEAIEWVKRAPFDINSGVEVEVRQVSEAADFGDALNPELQAREAKIGEQMRENAKQ
jgi:hypothetical protein